MIPPLRWNERSDYVELPDQTHLPTEEWWLDIRSPAEMAAAIRMLRIRGAPAIGIAATYGVVLALRDKPENAYEAVHSAITMFATTRPTAVNLFYALNRMCSVADTYRNVSCSALRDRLLENARRIEIKHIQPGKPQQNAYIERFNRTVRHDWLNQHLFESIRQVQEGATKWLWTYNNERQGMGLGGITPKQKLAMVA